MSVRDVQIKLSPEQFRLYTMASVSAHPSQPLRHYDRSPTQNYHKPTVDPSPTDSSTSARERRLATMTPTVNDLASKAHDALLGVSKILSCDEREPGCLPTAEHVAALSAQMDELKTAMARVESRLSDARRTIGHA